MKSLPKLLMASVLAGILLLALAASAQQLPTPVDKTLAPGIHNVSYAGQTFRVNTPTTLRLSFRPVSFTRIKITFRAFGSPAQGAAGNDLEIFWEDWGTDIYNGSPPTTSEDVEVDTESGYTEK